MVVRDLDFGIGAHTIGLVNHLRQKGIEVDIHKGKGDLRTNAIPKTLKGYDVIHVQGSCFGASGSKTTPMVTTVHTLLKTEWKYEKKLSYKLGRPYEDLTLSKSNHIVAVSGIIKTELEESYKVKEEKITVVPNGIDVTEFDEFEDVDRNPVFVMSCGRDIKRKDFKTLKDACKKCGVPLQLFHGELTRPELIQKYKEASVFVCPSLYESFGYFIAEAMASKCPVICSDIEAFYPFVFSGDTGLMFRRGDVDDLSLKLKYLLWHEELRQKIAKNAYEWIKEAFNWKEVVEKTIQVYEEVKV